MFSFFGPPDPTRTWLRSPDLQLECDLASATLNGVKPGSPLEAVSFLGPVEDRSGLKNGWCNYPSLGLCIVFLDDSTIQQFEIIRQVKSRRERLFPVTVRHGDLILDLDSLNEPAFVERFGTPYWRDLDDQEILLFYEFPQLEWQVEFELNGSFKGTSVTADPLLAQADQRNAYGVTKSWPPEFGR